MELTSRRDDGTWTWRAAGAREPRGTLDGALLPADAAVGNVLRAEADMDVDGILITSVLPNKNARVEPQRLEIIGRPRSEDQLVTTTLAKRGSGERRGGGRREGGREGGRDGGRDFGRDRPRGDRPGGDRPGGDGERRGARPGGPGAPGGFERRPSFERKAPLEPKPKAKRLRAGRAHRQALIGSLPEEQRPIADELAKAGVPGVRAALDKQNEQARTEGRPEIDPAPLMTLAEQLWPRMRVAEWRDRAEAALREVDELDLRDLRSVVVAADGMTRDEESREMATQLREALTRRVDDEQNKWLVEIGELVADGRVVAALRRSSRPPKAGAPLPGELAQTLIDKTNEALAADVAHDRWAVLLDALAYSPVRTSVVPTGVPETPSDELLAAVRKVAGRLTTIAGLFGVAAESTPPVGASRGPRRTGSRPAGRPAPTAETPAPTGDDAAAVDASDTRAVEGEAATEAPVLDSPASEETPAADTSGDEAPVADFPVADSPVADSPVADSPAADDEPARDDAPAAVTDDPAADDEPAAVADDAAGAEPVDADLAPEPTASDAPSEE